MDHNRIACMYGLGNNKDPLQLHPLLVLVLAITYTSKYLQDVTLLLTISYAMFIEVTDVAHRAQTYSTHIYKLTEYVHGGGTTMGFYWSSYVSAITCLLYVGFDFLLCSCYAQTEYHRLNRRSWGSSLGTSKLVKIISDLSSCITSADCQLEPP